jgi:acyl-CoA thioesterase-1
MGLCLLCAAARADTVLVLGDSIGAAFGLRPEQGWVAKLRDRLGPQHTVVNASVSGETTGGGLARLPALLERHEPDVVVVELGGNDGLRGYPLGRIRANLDALVERSWTTGARVLLLGMRIPPNYGPRYADGFHALFAAVADDRDGVALVPFFLEGVAAEPGMMQADGIHPTAAAQERLARVAVDALERLRAGPGSPLR